MYYNCKIIFFGMFFCIFFFKRAIRSFHFFMSDVSESLRLLTKNEHCEGIAQVAHQKLSTMSDSLRSLTKNDIP